jgi:hypothetical protein
MTRRVHDEGIRERREMKNNSYEEAYDLFWVDTEGKHHHICRYSNLGEARDAKKRLSNPSDEDKRLLGVPETPDLKIISE